MRTLCGQSASTPSVAPTAPSIEDPTPLLTVFVDANEAASTNGQAGVTVLGGPRVGEAAIEAILCDGIIEVTARTKHGTPLRMGRRSRPIPPQLRRFIMDRDGAACTIAGCTSKYRLQVHHIKRWIDGGRTDPENLTTVCWFHHQVVIHGHGFTIDPDSPPQRRRLLHPPIHGPPWLEQARARGMVVESQDSDSETRDPILPLSLPPTTQWGRVAERRSRREGASLNARARVRPARRMTVQSDRCASPARAQRGRERSAWEPASQR